MVYWVRADGNGDDGKSGADYENALATVDEAWVRLNSAGSKGDSVYLVNDGVHAWPSTSVTQLSASLSGTDYDSDPGLIVKGVDSSGNDARATVAASSGQAGGHFIHVRGGVDYTRLDNLHFDATDGDSSSVFTVCVFTSPAGPVRTSYCTFRGFTAGSIGSGDRRMYYWSSTGPNDYGEIRYSYFVDCPETLATLQFGSTFKLRVHHCVYDYTGPWRRVVQGTAVAASGNLLEFYHNTVYLDLTDASGGVPEVVRHGSTSGDMGTANVHSNLVWLNTATTSVPFSQGTMLSIGGSASTATVAGTVGYNVMYMGPDVESADLNTDGFYDQPYDSGTDPLSTDNVAYEQAASVLFNDATSQLVWSVDGVNITLDRDLRPIILRSAGESGSVPGAISAAIIDPVTPGGGGGDSDPSQQPKYLDVLPFFQDVLEIDFDPTVRIFTEVGELDLEVLRQSRPDDDVWTESVSRTMVVNTNSTTNINLGGIAAVEYFMLESERPVDIAVGSNVLPGVQVCALHGNFSSLAITNNNTTNTASVVLVAVD